MEATRGKGGWEYKTLHARMKSQAGPVALTPYRKHKLATKKVPVKGFDKVIQNSSKSYIIKS